MGLDNFQPIDNRLLFKLITPPGKRDRGFMEYLQLPMWTEIHIQPIDTGKGEEAKVFWIKHPRLKTTVYDADLAEAIKGFLHLCKLNNITD